LYVPALTVESTVSRTPPCPLETSIEFGSGIVAGIEAFVDVRGNDLFSSLTFNQVEKQIEWEITQQDYINLDRFINAATTARPVSAQFTISMRFVTKTVGSTEAPAYDYFTIALTGNSQSEADLCSYNASLI
jgi:hypothetical protein